MSKAPHLMVRRINLRWGGGISGRPRRRGKGGGLEVLRDNVYYLL